jgi:hypothetical protein
MVFVIVPLPLLLLPSVLAAGITSAASDGNAGKRDARNSIIYMSYK